MKGKKRILASVVLVVVLCMGIGFAGGQKTAQAVTKAQVNKKITALKKQIKSLEKKVAAAQKKEKKESKGTVAIMGTIVSRNPFVVHENLLGRSSYYWVEDSQNLTNLFTQSLGTVKLTGKYRNYNGYTCAVCKAVKTSNKSAKYKEQLAKKKKQLRSYQNALQEKIILKETNVGVGEKANVKAYWKYSGKYNTVMWKSSNSGVAKIDSHGKISGVKQGKAVITATCSLSKKKSQCTVYVRDYFHVYNSATGEEIYSDDEIETTEKTVPLKCEFSSKNTKDTFEYKCENDDGEATISKDGLITFSKYGTVYITVSSSYVYTEFTVTYQSDSEDWYMEEEDEEWEEVFEEDVDVEDEEWEEASEDDIDLENEKPCFKAYLNGCESSGNKAILTADEYSQVQVTDFGCYELLAMAETDFEIGNGRGTFSFHTNLEGTPDNYSVSIESVVIEGIEYEWSLEPNDDGGRDIIVESAWVDVDGEIYWEPEPITIEKGEIVRVYFDVVPGQGAG